MTAPTLIYPSAALGSAFSEVASWIAPARAARPKDFQSRLDRFRQRQGFAPGRGQEAVIRAVHAAVTGDGPREIWVKSGKRSGKTTCAKDLIEEEMQWDEGIIWIAAPSYPLGDKIFDAVTEGFPRNHVRNQPPKQAKFGKTGWLKVRSWENLGSIEGDGVMLLIADEGQLLTSTAYKKLRARLVDTGGILIVFGAPLQDSDFFLTKFEQIQEMEALCERTGELPTARTLYFSTEDNPNVEVQINLQGERLALSHEEYGEMYLGVPGRPEGVVFPTFNKDIHTGNVPFNPDLPVTLMVDPGQRWYGVNAVQVLGGQVRMIEAMKLGPQATDYQVIAEVGKKPWWQNVYKSGGGLVSDIAAKAHRAESERSTADNWETFTGLKPDMRFIEVAAGHTVLQSFLLDPMTGQPMLICDATLCKPFIEEMFKYKYNALGRPIDRDNHNIKALIYFLVARFGYTPLIEKKAKPAYSYLSDPERRRRRSVRRTL